jgi:hypothetical protein
MISRRCIVGNLRRRWTGNFSVLYGRNFQDMKSGKFSEVGGEEFSGCREFQGCRVKNI